MKNRRSLTPNAGLPAGPDDVHATRRGGARHDVTARVSLKAKDGTVHDGWALNISRGGIRVILEEKVDLGTEFEVTMTTGGDEPTSPVMGRVVWVQEEPDGAVVGIEFR